MQEYFFPKKEKEDKEEGSGTKRQQTWVKSVDAKLKARKSSQGPLAAAVATEGGPGGELVPPELAAVRLGRPDGGTKSAVNTPHVPSTTSGSLSGAGRPFSASEVHRRGPHWDGSSAAEMLKQVLLKHPPPSGPFVLEMRPSPSLSNISAASFAASSVPLILALGRSVWCQVINVRTRSQIALTGVHEKCPVQSHKALALRRLSERPGAEGAAAEEGNSSVDEEAMLAAAAEKKAVTAARRKIAVEARKVLFVHVRLNRVHCRVTYQVG